VKQKIPRFNEVGSVISSAEKGTTKGVEKGGKFWEMKGRPESRSPEREGL